tara:strand:- start:4868 stop:5119 length:252 start_codon:yes stop_codon:yes gene_type:complete
MTKATTPKRQKTNKKIWKKRVLSGKELAKARREKLMEYRKKANEQNRIKKQLISQRNLIKELRKALREETKLRKNLEKQLEKK